LIYRGTIDSDHPGYTGDGFVNYRNEIDSYVEFNIHIPVSGTSTLIFRYANGTSQNRSCDVYLNGVMAVDDLSFPETGEWQEWGTRRCPLTMNGGYNTIRLTADQSDGGPNLDRMDVLPVKWVYLGW
jgi:endoglucanase